MTDLETDTSAKLLFVQLMPAFTADELGVKIAAAEAVPAPEVFLARIFIEYEVQFVKPLLIIIGLFVIEGIGLFQVEPLFVEY